MTGIEKIGEDFMAAADQAVERQFKRKRAETALRQVKKHLDSHSAFETSNIKSFSGRDGQVFEIHCNGLQGNTFLVGSLLLDRNEPDALQAKIYDHQYGWQAEPTLIPLDPAKKEERAEAMTQFMNNIFSDFSLEELHAGNPGL